MWHLVKNLLVNAGNINDRIAVDWTHQMSLVAQMVKHLRAMRETWVPSLGQEDPLEKEVAPTPLFLPGEVHGQRSLGATVHGAAKSQTQLLLLLLSRFSCVRLCATP